MPSAWPGLGVDPSTPCRCSQHAMRRRRVTKSRDAVVLQAWCCKLGVASVVLQASDQAAADAASARRRIHAQQHQVRGIVAELHHRKTRQAAALAGDQNPGLRAADLRGHADGCVAPGQTGLDPGARLGRQACCLARIAPGAVRARHCGLRGRMRDGVMRCGAGGRASPTACAHHPSLTARSTSLRVRAGRCVAHTAGDTTASTRQP